MQNWRYRPDLATRGGLWACSLKKFVEIRFFEIASEAIFGQKQSTVLHGSWSIASKFWLSMYAFANPADFKLPREKVLSWQNSRWGDITR